MVRRQTTPDTPYYCTTPADDRILWTSMKKCSLQRQRFAASQKSTPRTETAFRGRSPEADGWLLQRRPAPEVETTAAPPIYRKPGPGNPRQRMNSVSRRRQTARVCLIPNELASTNQWRPSAQDDLGVSPDPTPAFACQLPDGNAHCGQLAKADHEKANQYQDFHGTLRLKSTSPVVRVSVSLTRTQFGGPSASGFTGFYDWTGLGRSPQGNRIISSTPVTPAKAGVH